MADLKKIQRETRKYMKYRILSFKSDFKLY